jgi:DNA-binding transcriptional LysR family regulator
LAHYRYLLGYDKMELRQLRYIIAVAEEGNVTRAAERLGIQPPPLSRQIRAVEHEVDAQLFRRKPRGVELTDAGRAFIENARAVLAQVDHTFETTRRTARGERGCISVGYSSSIAFHPLVPRIVREFRQAFPLVTVTLSEGFPDNLIERVRIDQIDVAFIRRTTSKPESVDSVLLLEEPMVVAVPSGHALIQRDRGRNAPLLLKALAGETFLLGPPTSQSDAFVAACRAAGFSARVGQSVPNISSRLNLIAAGLGIAVVAASLQHIRIEGVVFRHLKGIGHVKAPLSVASRRGDTSPVVRQFLKLTKQAARNFRVDDRKAS